MTGHRMYVDLFRVHVRLCSGQVHGAYNTPLKPLDAGAFEATNRKLRAVFGDCAFYESGSNYFFLLLE